MTESHLLQEADQDRDSLDVYEYESGEEPAKVSRLDDNEGHSPTELIDIATDTDLDTTSSEEDIDLSDGGSVTSESKDTDSSDAGSDSEDTDSNNEIQIQLSL